MVQSVGEIARPKEQITMKSLLEAGVHFGHQTRRWNPNMKRYIFTHRNGIHIIDLQQTLVALERAYKAITEIVAEGGDVLFVGTKKQAQESVHNEATRCSMPYVNQRWLGGTLTNFKTIRSRVEHMFQLEERKEKGQFQTLVKKEALKLDEELARLQKYFGGIRSMKTLPGALFILDIEREDICVAEARRMGIPVAAVVDSNCDPDQVTYAIPGNDDAIRSIRLMSVRIADAVIVGLEQRAEMIEAEVAEEEPTPVSEEEQPREVYYTVSRELLEAQEAFDEDGRLGPSIDTSHGRTAEVVVTEEIGDQIEAQEPSSEAATATESAALELREEEMGEQVEAQEPSSETATATESAALELREEEMGEQVEAQEPSSETATATESSALELREEEVGEQVEAQEPSSETATATESSAPELREEDTSEGIVQEAMDDAGQEDGKEQQGP